MNEQQIEKQVKIALQYLMDEGLVVQEGKYYRMKTDEEIAEEINFIMKN
jgi:hypothetical protein